MKNLFNRKDILQKSFSGFDVFRIFTSLRCGKAFNSVQNTFQTFHRRNAIKAGKSSKNKDFAICFIQIFLLTFSGSSLRYDAEKSLTICKIPFIHFTVEIQ
jgi:hypothetical protein